MIGIFVIILLGIFSGEVRSLKFFPSFRFVENVISSTTKRSSRPAVSTVFTSASINSSPYPSIQPVQYMGLAPVKPISIASEQSYVFGNTPTPINRKPVLTRLLAWILHRVLERRTEFVSGLHVKVASNSSMDILQGKVGRVDVSFQKICFQQLYCTGGGRLTLEGMEFGMRRLLFKNKQPLRKPYQVFGDLLLTQADVVNSKFIRDLIQLLVNLIAERAFTAFLGTLATKVNIRRVSLKDQRLLAYGDATCMFGNNSITTISFEVSTGAGIRENGHVVYLKDIQLVINPDHSVLRASVSIPLTTPIDVDIGDDCNIISLVLGEKHVWIRARSTILPDLENMPLSSTNREAKKALYRYDLSRLFSSILRLSGGLAVRWVNSRKGGLWERYRSPR